MGRGMRVEENLSVEERIVKILKEVLDINEVDTDTDLTEEMDSLDIVEVFICIEEEFGVDIEDEEFEDLKTVQDIVTFLEGK